MLNVDKHSDLPPSSPSRQRRRFRRPWAWLAGAALLLLLTACPGGQVATPDFTMSLSSSSISIEQGGSDSVTVTVTGTGGFSGNVNLALEGAPSGVTGTFSSNPVSAAGLGVQGTSTLTLDVANSAAAQTSNLTIRGTPDDASISAKTQTLSLTVTPPPASIDTVEVQGQSGNQVRQGFGTITLNITGTNLANIALAKLGDLNGTVQTNNNLAASIQFTIPTGESIGSKDLSVTADAGTATFSGAVQVTAITANANTGNDGNLGTPDSPFKTLTQAASVAGSGDSIDLADGTYDTANGETFPVTISGVSLSGASEAGTIIDGTGVAGTDGLFSASGPTSISNLTVSNIGEGIDINGGDGTISNVTVDTTGTDAGIELSGSGDFTLSNVTVSNTTNEGIDIDGTGTSTFTNITINNAGSDGINVSGAGSFTFSTVTVDSSGDDGIDLESTIGTASLSSPTATNNNDSGIEVNGGTVTISNSSTSGNFDGIRANGTTNVSISDSTANNNGFDGFQFGAGTNGVTGTLTNSTANANNDNGVEINGDSAVTVTGLTATNNQDLGVELGGFSGGFTGGAASISGGTISNNGSIANESGIGTSLGISNSSLTVDGTTLDSNAQSGIEFNSTGGSLTVRNATIQNNGDHGIEILGTPAVVNLGDAGTSGNNTITLNTNFQLSDARPAGQAVIITAFGVDLGGAGAPPTGTFTGPTSNSNRFEIINNGNQIDFGP